ncbi:ice-binding family protein [Nocardioides astragali]|uniref:Ice-binding family protein n=1 Tax=Nocardioides astragali TaxID=1776736 RepID=A0ABW2N761_9ACTN|nr:ice-binding family protein [Nocardioides astragali]
MSPSRPAQLLTRTTTARLAVAATALMVVGPLVTATSAAAAAPTVAGSVALGRAAGFSALAGPSITNPATATGTVLALDLGVTGTLTGFPPGTVNGTTRVGTDEVEAAHEDRQAAYDSVVAQTGGTAFGGDLVGKTFTPGLYSTAAAVTNTGTIILDAEDDPNAIFVFQIGAALSSAASTKVVLTNGALANNVYWQVVGAVALGANAKWAGTILAEGAISFGDGASLKGRALTSSTMALANSPITRPIDDLVAPVVALNGGPSRSTRDTTPPVSGTTDEPGTPVVTVTTGTLVLTTRAHAGAWTLSTHALAQGSHTVVASVTDPSGNTGTATQQLTVDADAPGVTVLGGTSAATSDTTPSISGTTTEPDATVSVMVGDQTLTTVASAGTWTVEAAALTETAHLVLASVDDAAGNTGSASQVLTVDLTVPVVVIDGGASRSTTDLSPWTYGTTAERAGTVVDVNVDDQLLTATVNPGGTWGVSAEDLAPGTYEVVASITDAALNEGSAHQTLVVAPPGEVPAPTPTTTTTTTTTTSTPTNPTPTATPTPNPTDVPPTAAAYRPDAEIRRGRGRFVGAEVYTLADQRVAATLRGRARQVSFQVRVTNQGDTAEKLKLAGTRSNRAFRLTYVAGGKDVSAAVIDGRYRTETLAVGRSVTVTVTVTRLKRAKPGTATTMTVRTVSTHAPSKVDAVAARVTVAG